MSTSHHHCVLNSTILLLFLKFTEIPIFSVKTYYQIWVNSSYFSQTKQNHSTIYAWHHSTQTNTNDTNETWALLQTTGGKDEQNIVFIPTQTHKKNQGWIQKLAKGKQFLLLIRHPSCYPYIQSSPVKVLGVIEERKHLSKK